MEELSKCLSVERWLRNAYIRNGKEALITALTLTFPPVERKRTFLSHFISGSRQMDGGHGYDMPPAQALLIMRADLFFLTITPFVTLSLCAAVGVDRHVAKHDPLPLPSHLHAPTTFYRAVTGDQVAFAPDTYPIGKAPTGHRNTTGDFSQIGAMAVTYGSCFAKLHPTYKQWYLVGLSYTPNEKLKVKTFHVADREWKLFIRNNYTHKRPQHDYNIVEGAYSYGADGTDQVEVWLDPVNGELLWQAAFIGQDALHTLAVQELSLHGASDDPNLLVGVEQHPLQERPFISASECMQTAPATG
ncbi:hypothetical protein DXG01_006178 [Tephrocybe rancida]|nr:hypothetical protein DXG01_006178 [Tephrocybe rancida]